MSENVFFFDGYRNPVRWAPSVEENGVKECSLLNLDQLVLDMKDVVGSDSKSSVLFIDSLSALLLRYDVSKVCRFLTRLMNQLKFGSLVMVLHRDLHRESVVNSISEIPKTLIQVVSPPLNVITRIDLTFNLIQKRKLGKISFKKMHLSLKENDTTNFIEDKYVEYMTEEENIITENTNPASNLSFSVTLTEEEKQKRSQIELPYQNTTNTVIFLNEGDDAFDDFESDPDDDLDF